MTQHDNAPAGFVTVVVSADLTLYEHEKPCAWLGRMSRVEEHREWCERVTAAGEAHANRAVEPTTKPRDETPPPKRDELWSALDWCLWGQGMGNTFREPLADKMLAALTPEERSQALALIAWWKEHRGGPSWQIAYDELKAERDQALDEVRRLRAKAGEVPYA